MEEIQEIFKDDSQSSMPANSSSVEISQDLIGEAEAHKLGLLEQTHFLLEALQNEANNVKRKEQEVLEKIKNEVLSKSDADLKSVYEFLDQGYDGPQLQIAI